jgi:hypothetical protein
VGVNDEEDAEERFWGATTPVTVTESLYGWRTNIVLVASKRAINCAVIPTSYHAKKEAQLRVLPINRRLWESNGGRRYW